MLWFPVQTIVLWLLGSDNSKYVVCAFRTPTSSSSITTSNVQQISQFQNNVNGLFLSERTLSFQTYSNSKTRRKVITNDRRIVSTTALFFGSQPDNPLEILDEVDPGLHKKKKNLAKEEAIGLAYKHLGLEPHTYLDKVVLKNAYKRMATKYHPDVVINRDSTAEEKIEANDNFAIINAAYKTLRVLYVEKGDPQISGTYYSQKKGSNADTSTTTTTNENTSAQKEEKEILIRDKHSRKGKHRRNGWWQVSFPRIYDTRDYFDHVPPIQDHPSVDRKTSDKEATITIDNTFAPDNNHMDEELGTEIAPAEIIDSLVEGMTPPLDSIAHNNGVDNKPSYPNDDDNNVVDESKFKYQNDKKIETSTSSNSVPGVHNVWRDVISPTTTPRKVYTRIPGRMISTDKRKAKDDFANFNGGASNVNFLGQGGHTMISPLSSSRWTTKYVSTRTESKKRSVASSYYRRKNTGSSRTIKLNNKKEGTTNTNSTRQKGEKISPTRSTYSGNSSEEAKLRKRHVNRNAMTSFEKISSSLSDALKGQGAHAAISTSPQRNAKTRQGSVPVQHRSKAFVEKKRIQETALVQRRSNSSIKKTNSPKIATGGIKNWWKDPTSREMHQRIYTRTEQTPSENTLKSPSKLPHDEIGEESEPQNVSEAQSVTQAIINNNEASMKQEEALPVATSLSTSTNNQGISMEECKTFQSQTDNESFANKYNKQPTVGAIPNWWDKYQPVQGYGDLPLTSTSICDEDGTPKAKSGVDAYVASDIISKLPQEKEESETNTIIIKNNTNEAKLSDGLHRAASSLSLEVSAEASEHQQHRDNNLSTKQNTQLKINSYDEQPLSPGVFSISPFVGINEDSTPEGNDRAECKSAVDTVNDLNEVLTTNKAGGIVKSPPQGKEESETNTIAIETNTNEAEWSNGVYPAVILSLLETSPEAAFEHKEHHDNNLFTDQSIHAEINGVAEEPMSSEEFSMPTFIDTDEDNTPEGNDRGEYKGAVDIINDLNEVLTTDEDCTRAALSSPESIHRRVTGGPGFMFASGIIKKLNRVLTTDEAYPQAALLSPEAYIATFYKNAESNVEESISSKLSDSFVKQNSQHGGLPLTNLDKFSKHKQEHTAKDDLEESEALIGHAKDAIATSLDFDGASITKESHLAGAHLTLDRRCENESN